MTAPTFEVFNIIHLNVLQMTHQQQRSVFTVQNVSLCSKTSSLLLDACRKLCVAATSLSFLLMKSRSLLPQDCNFPTFWNRNNWHEICKQLFWLHQAASVHVLRWLLSIIYAEEGRSQCADIRNMVSPISKPSSQP